MSERQEKIKKKLKKIVQALIVLGVFWFLQTVFKEVASILATFVVLVVIWQYQIEIRTSQKMTEKRIENMESILVEEVKGQDNVE